MGSVFALYSVAIILVSPVVGRFMNRWGYKNVLTASQCLYGIAWICFGFIESMENVDSIIVLGYITRFIQGVGSAFMQTTNYSIATTCFSKNQERMIGLLEAATGIGLGVGPVIGSALYSFFGFWNTFLFYGLGLILTGVLLWLTIPVRD